MVKKRVNMMLEPGQIDQLKELSRVSRIRMSEFIREGLDLILKKYHKLLTAHKK